MSNWFILIDGEVQGPFEDQEVVATYNSHNGDKLDISIWGKGQSEWVDFEKWEKILKNSHSSLKKTISSPSTWKIRSGSEEKGPFDYKNLIAVLKKYSDFGRLQLKSDRDSGWKDIYSFEDVIADLGITRRSHPRAPIMGNLSCEQDNHSFSLKLTTISQGGMGANGNSHLNIGETFRFKIESPSIKSEIFGNAEVIYVGNEGYVGLKFINLASEFQTLVTDYVKKFQS